MLKNYPLIFYRNMVRNKAYAAINIVGLAILYGRAAEKGERYPEGAWQLSFRDCTTADTGLCTAG